VTSRRRRAVAGGSAATGSSLATSKQGLPATNRDGENFEMKRRARGLTWELGREGEAPEERIGAARQSSGCPSVRRRYASEERMGRWCGWRGSSGGLYRAEGEGGRAR
jgi:hypothetical protein